MNDGNTTIDRAAAADARAQDLHHQSRCLAVDPSKGAEAARLLNEAIAAEEDAAALWALV